jgi:hypothetical protein
MIFQDNLIHVLLLQQRHFALAHLAGAVSSLGKVSKGKVFAIEKGVEPK